MSIAHKILWALCFIVLLWTVVKRKGYKSQTEGRRSGRAPLRLMYASWSSLARTLLGLDEFRRFYATRWTSVRSRRFAGPCGSDVSRMGSQGSPVKSYDYLLKFLLVGDSDVGKGEILDSLQDGSAESPYAYSSGEYRTTHSSFFTCPARWPGFLHTNNTFGTRSWFFLYANHTDRSLICPGGCGFKAIVTIRVYTWTNNTAQGCGFDSSTVIRACLSPPLASCMGCGFMFNATIRS